MHVLAPQLDFAQPQAFTVRWTRVKEGSMRLRLQSLERRREQRQALRRAKRRDRIQREAAKRTALRSRDEHTGGYGDPPYGP
jgi:hypothetical protein